MTFVQKNHKNRQGTMLKFLALVMLVIGVTVAVEAPPPLKTVGLHDAPTDSAAVEDATAEPEDQVPQELYDLPVDKTDWALDDASGYYYSESAQLFFDRVSGQFYDPASDQWYNPETEQWYKSEM